MTSRRDGDGTIEQTPRAQALLAAASSTCRSGRRISGEGRRDEEGLPAPARRHVGSPSSCSGDVFPSGWSSRATPGTQDVFERVHQRPARASRCPSTKAPADRRRHRDAPRSRESGETAVQRSLGWTIPGCGGAATDFYTVPAGKYLRIEQVTLLQPLPQDPIAWFRVQTDGVPHWLEHNRDGVSQLVRLYASPGSTVAFSLGTTCPHADGIHFGGSFSGVLIDAP